MSEIDKDNIRKELLVKPYIPKSIITQTPKEVKDAKAEEVEELKNLKR